MFGPSRGVNSYPYQKSQMPCAQFYHPSWEAYPPQMMENPDRSPHVNESWHHNHGYPTPMPYHSCCSHGLHPSYYNYRPPYPHFPPPSTFGHCCSDYPAAYPQPYPYAPPPHYVMDVPRYGYDKSAPNTSHCCGCPNHSCYVKDKNNVKIEEQEPEVETKKSESLVPGGANNPPYPILWIPPGYIKSGEQSRMMVENDSDKQQVSADNKNHYVVPTVHNQAEVSENQSYPHIKKPNQIMQTVEQDPNVKYRWFPLDMNSIKQLLEGGDAIKAQDLEKKSGDKKKAHDQDNETKDHSYPIIWMPYDGQVNDHDRDKEKIKSGGVAAGQRPCGFNVVPMKEEHSAKDSEKERTVEPNGDQAGGCKRIGNVRTIPVMQLEDSPKLPVKDHEYKQGGTPTREVVGQVQQEPAKSSSTTESSSPKKKSKLPPICLRVDPPKKKNLNGSSRSPSPPGDKKSLRSGDAEVKRKDEKLRSGKEIQVQQAAEKKPNGNKIDVSYGTSKQDQVPNTQNFTGEAEKHVMLDDTKSGDVSGHPELQAVEESKHDERGTSARKVMTRTEAAILIQSAYRGYELRRWEPLKKLRQIANIRIEASMVKRRIKELESQATVDDREKVIVGETIMKLLLELDTIQGVHPSIRDVRRLLAKELTILQEKLDSVVIEKPMCTGHGPEGVQKHAEASGFGQGSLSSSEVVGDDVKISSLTETLGAEKIAEPGNGDGGPIINKIPVSQSLAVEDIVCTPERVEALEASLGEKCLQGQPESLRLSDAGSATDQEEAGLCIELKAEELEDQRVVLQDSVSTPQEPSGDLKSLAGAEVQFDAESSKENQEADLLAELPEVVIEHEISRMDSDCDLGTAKLTGSEGQDETELVSQEVVEEQAIDEICRMDWECDLGTAKITSLAEEATEEATPTCIEVIEQEVKQDKDGQAESHELVNNKAENETPMAYCSEVVMNLGLNQLSEKPDVRCDSCEDPIAVEHEHPVPVEVTSEEHIDEETPDREPRRQVEKSVDVSGNGAASGGKPDTVVASPKILVRDDNNECEPSAEHDESNTEAVDESLTNLQVSNTIEQAPNEPGTVKKENNVGAETSQTDVQQLTDDGEASTLSSDGQGSAMASDNRDLTEKRATEEENEKLKEMLENLLTSGKEHQDVISSLTAKVKELEKKLAKEKKMKSAKRSRVRVSRPSCGKSGNGSLKQRPMGVAS